jgi:pilus assembly protein TadC
VQGVGEKWLFSSISRGFGYAYEAARIRVKEIKYASQNMASINIFTILLSPSRGFGYGFDAGGIRVKHGGIGSAPAVKGPCLNILVHVRV